jgi:D-threo-aldose 1-dehydrogenase
MAEAALNKVRLGRTDLMVTPICFGTSGLGDMPDTYGYGVDEERAKATVKAIFDNPVNFLDSSRIYGMGRSEERIGAVIRERGGLPPGFVISTKLDRDLETNRFDAAQARRSLERSLKALGLERIDVLNLHDPEHSRSLEEATSRDGALGELFRIKEEGLAEAVGLAAGVVSVMTPLLRDWDFDAIITHNRFTLLNRNADAMLDLAKSRGIAVLNAAPYASGVLAKGSNEYPRYVYQEASAEALEPVRRIEAICARHGVPPGAAALQFSMRDPRVTSTIVGVTRPERVQQTLEWARFPIPEAAWRELMALPFATDAPEATRDYKPG